MLHDLAAARGVYTAECHDAEGNLKWSDTFENTVVIVGKNLALDSYLGATGGSAPGGSGPYMSLIDNTSFTAVNTADTMTSHSGWIEFISYSGSRPTCAWSASSGGTKTLSIPLVFTINGIGGTVVGGFIVFGTGASNVIGNTGGTLYSAGSFISGAKTVNPSDTVSVAYLASL